ncbi:MAG: hypothetical protein ACI8PZ_007210 [Myxococcota bacterium]|jgi:hypothetical protein
MNTRTRRIAQLASAGALTLALCAGAFAWLDAPRPEGIADDRADALAQQLMAAVDADAWERTGAITWTWAGSYTHLWDRERNFVRVHKGGWEVLVDLDRVQGVATVDGVALSGSARESAVAQAHALWANDSFWLTAPIKAFDPGTTRSRITQVGGSDALLVAYSSGGITPGDAYLWHLDNTGRPVSWQLWVSIIPVGGVSMSWDTWVHLPTGAWASTRHAVGPIEFWVTDLHAAARLAELEPGPDPFARLVDALGAPRAP